MAKKGVIFVGSFRKEVKDGATGGITFASDSLLGSSLADHFDFFLIDSSADAIPLPPVYKRIPKAINRIGLFLNYLMFKKCDTALIFTSKGFSLLEKGCMAIVAKMFGIRVVLAPRSGAIPQQVKTIPFIKWFLPKVINYCDVVICQSEYWCDFYKSVAKKTSRAQFEVIHNWIPIGEYHPKPPVAKDRLVILFLSWMTENKGIFDLIKAVDIVRQAQPDNFVVWMYGGGEAENASRELIHELGLGNYFEIKGWARSNDKQIAFETADIFVMPTHFEGFPNAMVESMLYKVPIIISDLDCLKDFVIHRQNAYAFPAKNIEALAAAILEMMRSPDLRKGLAQNAYLTVLHKNDISIAVQKFLQIL